MTAAEKGKDNPVGTVNEWGMQTNRDFAGIRHLGLQNGLRQLREHFSIGTFYTKEVARFIADSKGFPDLSNERFTIEEGLHNAFIKSGMVPFEQEQHGRKLRKVNATGAEIFFGIGYVYREGSVNFEELVRCALDLFEGNPRWTDPLQAYVAIRQREKMHVVTKPQTRRKLA